MFIFFTNFRLIQGSRATQSIVLLNEVFNLNVKVKIMSIKRRDNN